MSVPVEVRVADRDSESFNLIVRGNSVPQGSIIYGASNREILRNPAGNYVLDESDTAVFRFQAPLHWSDVSLSQHHLVYFRSCIHLFSLFGTLVLGSYKLDHLR